MSEEFSEEFLPMAGAFKDPVDTRDFIKEINSNIKPVSVNLLEDLPKFKAPNQFKTNACTGFSMSTFLTILYNKLTGFHHTFNPYYLYYWARQYSGHAGKDIGSTLRAVMKAACKNGVITTDMCKIKNTTTVPTFTDNNHAKILAIKDYFRLPMDNIKQGIIHTLVAEKLPVLAAFYCEPYRWRAAGINGVLEKAKYHPNSGHAVCIYGYDANDDTFLVMNSWGTCWGNKGSFKATADAVESDLYDIWTTSYYYF